MADWNLYALNRGILIAQSTIRNKCLVHRIQGTNFVAISSIGGCHNDNLQYQ